MAAEVLAGVLAAGVLAAVLDAADFAALGFAAFRATLPFGLAAGEAMASSSGGTPVGPFFSGSAVTATAGCSAAVADVCSIAAGAAGLGFIAWSNPDRTSSAARWSGFSAFLRSAAGFSLRMSLASVFTSSSSASFSASSNCLRKSPAIALSLAVVRPNWRSMRGKSLGPTTTIMTIAITRTSCQPMSNMAI